MPRKPRRCLPDITYHAMSRCIEKKSLMRPKRTKTLMIDTINLALDKYNFELAGYAIMDNHIHLYIKTLKDGENISRIMQFIKSQFARRYNRMMNRTGPFWNERFIDTITEFTYNPRATFINSLLYIHFNAVRSKYATDPRDYPFCSMNCYLDENFISPIKITLHDYFLELGNNFKECAQRLLEYEDMYRRRIFPESLFL